MAKYSPDSFQVTRSREMREQGHSLINIAQDVGVGLSQVHYFCNDPRFGPRIYPKGPLVNADGSKRDRTTLERMTTFHGVTLMRPPMSRARIRFAMAEDVEGGTMCTVKYFIPAE